MEEIVRDGLNFYSSDKNIDLAKNTLNPQLQY